MEAMARSVAMRMAMYGIIGSVTELRLTRPIWLTTTKSKPTGGTSAYGSVLNADGSVDVEATRASRRRP